MPLTLQQATVYPRLCQILLDNYRQVWVNLLSGHCSFLLVHVCNGFVCSLQESVSPLLWKFCNQIPLAFKIKFPEGFQFLCWISRLGNLFLTLELLQQCENFFGIIVLQFVGCLLSGSMVGLTCCASQVCCNQSPCPHSRPLLTHASAGDTQTLKGRTGSVSCGVLGSWCTQVFV